MIKEGIYTDLSSEEYHNDKTSFSRSSIMDFMRSPFHYWAKHLNPDRPKKDATRNMILGSAFHTLILENKLFVEQYEIEPTKVLLKDVGRNLYDIYCLKCKELEKTNKIILTAQEYFTLRDMRESLNKNLQALELLSSAEVEKSFFWRDKESGLMLKSRPDVLHRNMYVDLKTCNDCSPYAFQKEMVTYGYNLQGAMLRDAIRACEGHEMSNVINICVETKYPFTTAIYIIDEAALDHAEKQYKSKLLELRECLEKNEWPAYEIQTIGMPKWAL